MWSGGAVEMVEMVEMVVHVSIDCPRLNWLRPRAMTQNWKSTQQHFRYAGGVDYN